MKRISYDAFVNGNWGEDAYVIRVLEGELYMKAWVEEWPDAGSMLPEEDKEGFRIMESSLHDGIKMDMDIVRLGAFFDAVTEAEDYRYPLYFRYEEISEHCTDREDFKTVYDCLCSMAEPFERKGVQEDMDYEILLMQETEFEQIADILRDGDYIVVFSK